MRKIQHIAGITTILKSLSVVLLLISGEASAQFWNYGGWPGWAGDNSYSAEATALFARMTTQPDATRKQLYDVFITTLKTAGVWTKGDVCKIYAAHDQQAALLNMISTSHNSTLVNTPTFTTDRGFAGDGSTSYINENYNPSTQGVNFTLNAASQATYVRTLATVGNASNGGHNGTEAIQHFWINGSLGTRQYLNGADFAFPYNSALTGMKVGVRTSNTNIRCFQNGGAGSNTVKNSVTIPNVTLYSLAANGNGTPANHGNHQIAFVWYGGLLSDAEAEALFNAVEAYLDAVGAGVVE